MNRNYKFGLIGGDLRTVHLANKLYDNNRGILLYGIEENDGMCAPICSDLTEVIRFADILILPLPATDKNHNIYAPLYKSTIALNDVLKSVRKDQLILGGKLDEQTCLNFSEQGILYKDYFLHESLTITNALITAEGGIQILQEKYQKTLCNSKILILGYGRIGKFCAQILKGYGANVYIGGRRSETRALCEGYGFNYCDINEKKTYENQYDVIINTVPTCIMTPARLDLLPADCIVLDLASMPGGLDFEYAAKIHLQVIHALSLPGKTAPIAAGEAIYYAIKEICNDLEV